MYFRPDFTVYDARVRKARTMSGSAWSVGNELDIPHLRLTAPDGTGYLEARCEGGEIALQLLGHAPGFLKGDLLPGRGSVGVELDGRVAPAMIRTGYISGSDEPNEALHGDAISIRDVP